MLLEGNDTGFIVVHHFHLVLNQREGNGRSVGGHAFLAEKEKEYNDLFTNPYKAAEFGYVDDVIEPRNTRFRICRALAPLANKRETRPAKKHGNIPL